jgi:hypothetical protein
LESRSTAFLGKIWETVLGICKTKIEQKVAEICVVKKRNSMNGVKK